MRRPVENGSSNAESERGFIIVAVLWILGALSALVLIYLSYVTNTAMVVAANGDRPQAEALATAGIELAAYQLVSAPADTRPAGGQFNARVGPHRIAVSFASESARIDLNAASKQMLTGFFANLGARPDAAEFYAERIVAWRTVTSGDADANAETSFYRTSGATYEPRHAPFPQASELWLVRGIPPAFVERALPYLTTFSNQASIDPAVAPPAVVAALPNMTPERLQSVLAQRGDPNIDPRLIAGMAGEGASPEPSKAYRVTVIATFDNGRRSGTEAVIMLLDNAPEPFRVLAWRNLFDGDAALPQIAQR